MRFDSPQTPPYPRWRLRNDYVRWGWPCPSGPPDLAGATPSWRLSAYPFMVGQAFRVVAQNLQNPTSGSAATPTLSPLPPAPFAACMQARCLAAQPRTYVRLSGSQRARCGADPTPECHWTWGATENWVWEYYPAHLAAGEATFDITITNT